jgi:hypothetical protein
MRAVTGMFELHNICQWRAPDIGRARVYIPTATDLTTEGLGRVSANNRSQLQILEAYPHGLQSPLCSPSVQRHCGGAWCGADVRVGASIAVFHRVYVQEELGKSWDRNFNAEIG